MDSISSTSSGSPPPLPKSPKKPRQKLKWMKLDLHHITPSAIVPVTIPTEEPQRGRRQIPWKQRDREIAPKSPRQREALKGMRLWSWELATSKLPCDYTQGFGPKNEMFLDGVATGYQGMPREQCLLLYGMYAGDAIHLERFYRKLKETELVGAGRGIFPEQIFEETVIAWKTELALKEKEEKIRAQQELAEKARKIQMGDWPKWKGETKGDSKWPKWGEEQMEVTERAPAELVTAKVVERLDSFDLWPTPEPEETAVVTVAEMTDTPPSSPKEHLFDSTASTLAHQESIPVCS